MGKEVCKYFRKDIPPEEIKCGFAQYIVETPTPFMTIPEKGCGKTDIDKCPRITSPENFPLDEWGPISDTEMQIIFPVIRTNSRGQKRRLP